MRTLLCTLLAIIGALGCARIYRPVTLATPPASVRGEGLAGHLAPQPWGDNSRYERKALRANLRVLALTLENTSSADLEILRLDLPAGATALPPEAATTLVKQRSLAYLLYPLLPGLASLGTAGRSSSGPVVLSDQAVFQGLTIAGACIGVPNAIVAARSNRRLEAFFREQAWAPGRLAASETRRGLIFLRGPDSRTPLAVQVIFRGPTGERSLTLGVQGAQGP